MKMTYFRPPSSMCYTVDANQWSDQNHRFKKCNMPWTWELSLRAAWTPDKVLQLQNTDKLPLVIHRSETCPPDRLSSISVKPGLTYTVSVAQMSLPLSERQRMTFALQAWEKTGNSFSVFVKFSSDSQKIFEYQPKLTVIEAFGYMGGYIGMWLGLSLYSLITDAEQWLRNFFLKRALKRREPVERYADTVACRTSLQQCVSWVTNTLGNSAKNLDRERENRHDR
ncbi:hypothetical protein HPB48_012643 [Haemaphysalis longicornis]|uniref:Uncharacterized protein n=1 Tax=Haemaphysalis longicornis TaxID=44386 RepID=A0A9J6G0E5_HAELO|nr:hypothetical protein HPB48_012643 [Haemaphysalis longicornis]